jgi:hypothetical protein
MNETFEEYKYAIRHKPTQKWVKFKNDDLELTVTTIKLVDFKDCLISSATKKILETFLKMSAFKNTPNYGIENFLEFELVKIKCSYTIKEHENTN